MGSSLVSKVERTGSAEGVGVGLCVQEWTAVSSMFQKFSDLNDTGILVARSFFFLEKKCFFFQRY